MSITKNVRFDTLFSSPLFLILWRMDTALVMGGLVAFAIPFAFLAFSVAARCSTAIFGEEKN